MSQRVTFCPVTGVELAASCQKVNGERGSVLMLITAAVGITLNNIAYGFLAGKCL